MVEQPAGVVSFLFSDIEGSTRMLQDLGAERYGDALAEHCRLLRDAFDRHGGFEVDYEGDSFFIAFSSAADAVGAAAEGREALAAQPWPDGRELRVRIGIHTGEPLLAPPKYVGLDVHRAARIAASGHGGQILLSAATAAALPDGRFELVDLGEHRFKDLSAAERVFQVGRERFPSIRSLYRTSLPVPATSFLGRERELGEVVALLGGARVVTLVGPGGTGKTRLAVQAAAEASEDFPDGVHWVALASLRDPALVLPAIAQALELESGADVATALAGKRTLLVLDNLEQLLPAAASALAELVAVAGSVRFLVTSREPLQLADERVYPVGTLDSVAGVELFLERAAALGVPLEEGDAVRTLCARLDHLPLALELAAARAVLFSPEQLVDRLSERLDLLRGARGVDPRQATLRATIQWSYDLLGVDEQRLLRALSVFAGGWTYEAAEEVAGAEADRLQSLLAKSLARRLGGRYSMLETIREFAREQLVAHDDASALERRHAEWLLALAERASPELAGSEQSRWLTLLENEHDNFRAVLERASPDVALQLTAALQSFWYKHGHIEEGRRRLEHAVASSSGQPDALRARLVQAAGVFAGAQNDSRRARELGEEGLALYQRLGDKRGAAIMLRDLGAAAVRRGDHEEARRFYEESAPLLRELGESTLLATVLANLGDLAFREGRLAEAEARAREALDLQREVGATFGIAVSLSTLGFIALSDGRGEDARVALEESMQLAHELGSTDNLAYAFEGLAAVAAVRAEWERAGLLLGRAEAIRDATATELEAAEQAVHQRTLATLPDAGLAARAAGRALSDAEAIAVAYGSASRT